MTPRPAIVVCMMLWAGLTAGGQDRTPDRVERLQQWIEAVEQHELGEADEALMRVASWDRTTLWNVWIDSNTIVSLAREPNITVFSTPVEPEPLSANFECRRRACARACACGWSRTAERTIPTVAARGEGRDRERGRGSSPETRRFVARRHRNARRGWRQPIPIPLVTQFGHHHVVSQRRPADRRRRCQRALGDGAAAARQGSSQNLRKLSPDPGRTNGSFGIAAAIYMQAETQIDAWHVDRAMKLFPKDPDVLFFAACAREWFSGPQIQNTLRSTTLARELFNLIGSESDELRRAERLFLATRSSTTPSEPSPGSGWDVSSAGATPSGRDRRVAASDDGHEEWLLLGRATCFSERKQTL